MEQSGIKNGLSISHMITMGFKHEPIDLGYNDLVARTSESGRVYVDPAGDTYPSITTVLKKRDRGLRNDLKRTRSGFVVVVAI